VSSSSPHDALIRAVFSRKEEAIGELRAALPASIAAAIDWSTLALVNAHFIDEALATRESDLLYTAKRADTDVMLYVLFEHQSSADGMMPLRLTRYMVRIWDAWLADHPGAKRLPAVLPIVLAHAERGWNTPTSMLELYDLDAPARALLAPHLLTFSFVLDDLQKKSDAELLARTMTALARLTLLLLRHTRDSKRLLDRLVEWADLWRAIHATADLDHGFDQVISYLLLVTGHSSVEDLAKRLEPVLGAAVREKVMLTLQEQVAEMFRAQYEAQGRAEGEAKGRAEGEAKGRAHALLTVLSSRGLAVSVNERERIVACTDLQTLDHWLARAAVGKSTAEVLADH
jgi:predicted transposase/invertase (TIGR01784 family)